MTRKEIARLIDHTELHAYATLIDIDELCDEAVEHGFASVTVNPVWVSYCAKRLKGTRVLTNAVVGFPLGANTPRVKAEEAREAIANGAGEIDMVINVGALKSGYSDFVEQEIASLVGVAGRIPVKVILETSYLTVEEKVAVCQMSHRAAAAFVKTSTGYGTGGATVEDVALMRKTVGDVMGVKAAGGIRTYVQAMALIKAGATRLGTSAGIEILADAPQ